MSERRGGVEECRIGNNVKRDAGEKGRQGGQRAGAGPKAGRGAEEAYAGGPGQRRKWRVRCMVSCNGLAAATESTARHAEEGPKGPERARGPRGTQTGKGGREGGGLSCCCGGPYGGSA